DALATVVLSPEVLAVAALAGTLAFHQPRALVGGEGVEPGAFAEVHAVAGAELAFAVVLVLGDAPALVGVADRGRGPRGLTAQRRGQRERPGRERLVPAERGQPLALGGAGIPVRARGFRGAGFLLEDAAGAGVVVKFRGFLECELQPLVVATPGVLQCRLRRRPAFGGGEHAELDRAFAAGLVAQHDIGEHREAAHVHAR